MTERRTPSAPLAAAAGATLAALAVLARTVLRRVAATPADGRLRHGLSELEIARRELELTRRELELSQLQARLAADETQVLPLVSAPSVPMPPAVTPAPVSLAASEPVAPPLPIRARAPAPTRTVAAPAVAIAPRPRPGYRARRLVLTGVGRVAVLLLSAVVGLIGAAAIWSATHSSSSGRSPFTTPFAATPARFRAAAAVAPLPMSGTTDVALVSGTEAMVFASPSRRASAHLVQALEVDGRPMPIVMMVETRRPGWLKVQLPVRPNLSTAWIPTGAHVRVKLDPYAVQVSRSRHVLTIWRGGRLFERDPVGIGAALSPTPLGRYYLADLLRSTDPTGLYGPYAFGLSAYSDVYTSFGGGDGQIGLHGTDDPAGIGHAVSHGCIRLSNAVITRLATLLPLGTPVAIGR